MGAAPTRLTGMCKPSPASTAAWARVCARAPRLVTCEGVGAPDADRVSGECGVHAQGGGGAGARMWLPVLPPRLRSSGRGVLLLGVRSRGPWRASVSHSALRLASLGHRVREEACRGEATWEAG